MSSIEKLQTLARMHEEAIRSGRIVRAASVMEEIDREIGDYGIHYCMHLEKHHPEKYRELVERREKTYIAIFPKPLHA